MPDRDGYEICEFIKRHPRLSHTPVLLMSGIVNDEVRERAARVQSAGILAKPFAADDLVRHLDGLMPRRSAAQAAREPAAAADPVVAVSRETTPIPEGAAAVLAQFLAMDGVQWPSSRTARASWSKRRPTRAWTPTWRPRSARASPSRPTGWAASWAAARSRA